MNATASVVSPGGLGLFAFTKRLKKSTSSSASLSIHLSSVLLRLVIAHLLTEGQLRQAVQVPVELVRLIIGRVRQRTRMESQQYLGVSNHDAGPEGIDHGNTEAFA